MSREMRLELGRAELGSRGSDHDLRRGGGGERRKNVRDTPFFVEKQRFTHTRMPVLQRLRTCWKTDHEHGFSFQKLWKA